MDQKTTLPLHAAPGEAAIANGLLRNMTMADIRSDPIAKLAEKHFGKKVKWDPKVVESIIDSELAPNQYDPLKLMLLEHAQCLEKYLWPRFDEQKATTNQVLLICLLVSEKIRQGLTPWETFESDPAKFSALFHRVLQLTVSPDADTLSLDVRRFLVIFLIHCFQNLVIRTVRVECQKLVAISLWSNLVHDTYRESLLNESAPLRKLWNASKKKFDAADQATQDTLIFERTWLCRLINDFVGMLYTIPEEGQVDESVVRYCERVLEFLIDLESQLPTRRFFNVLLNDHQTVPLCRLAPCMKREDKAVDLLTQLLDRLAFYSKFEINDQTGLALTELELEEARCGELTELQHIAFEHFRDILSELSVSNLASIEQRSDLLWHIEPVQTESLKQLCELLNMRSTPLLDSYEQHVDLKEFLLEVLITRYEKRPSQIDAINSTPLYPDEDTLFDDSLVQTQLYTGDRPLPLPKLNLQFLTLHDYLLRNFTLFRLESTYEIRQDIEDIVKRLKPRFDFDARETAFEGWSRMALPIDVDDIGELKLEKANIGESKPSSVQADITFDIGRYPQSIRTEWDTLRKHDVVFLITLAANETTENTYDESTDFKRHFGIKYVRGCEIVDRIDKYGKPINELEKSGMKDNTKLYSGHERKIRVAFDTNQYQIDTRKNDRVYESFNILVRRKSQENSFKAVLETVRDLMQSETVVPDWLQKVFLGYGDPASAHYTKMPNRIQEMDFCDTFLDLNHMKESFAGKTIRLASGTSEPPFVIRSLQENEAAPEEKSKKKSKKNATAETSRAPETLEVSSYKPKNMGPYPQDVPKKNATRFTPTQTEAIRSGMNLGLTIVVGPPGTGKTDVAAQTIANLYHNYPDQHTLIVTRSQQALDHVFEKALLLDIDPRHLLRLGHGEEELGSNTSFSKLGRISSFMRRGETLLREVSRLAETLGSYAGYGKSCETANYFFNYHVAPLWKQYQDKADQGSLEVIRDHFPFGSYFANAPKELFTEDMDREQALEAAMGCFRHLERMFSELEEIRPFELLRTGNHRANYLLTKEAKIIAMTSTQAALKRRELVDLKFKYDNVIILEAAQILEVETFIPLLLQEPEEGTNRLKRIVLMGDHHQLPPLVKNTAFQQYGKMEQSLFTRFVRLGVPTVQLDAQGCTRPSIAKLYSWRYHGLDDLPLVKTTPVFQSANPGLTYDYQLIDVEEYQGKGETEPVPYFYQNLGEAEYVVTMFQFMRLTGYPAEKISILTTCKGQVALIKDVLKKRCDWNPYFGGPAAVTTVDEHQGQQNDYILLSLVRTKTVGHLRDVRRLIVAVSRARLGLYVFCNKALFESCYELKPIFDLLTQRPCQLSLQHDESYPSTPRKPNDDKSTEPTTMDNVEELGKLVYQLSTEQLESVKSTEQDLEEAMQLDEDEEIEDA